MMYWIIQIILGLFLFSVYFFNADIDRAVFGMTNVVLYALVRGATMVFVPHFIIRAFIKRRRNTQISSIKLCFMALPLVLCAALVDAWIKTTAKSTLIPQQQRFLYLQENKESLLSEPELTLENSAPQSEFERGMEVGRKKALEKEMEQEQDQPFSKVFIKAVFLYLMWLLCYLPLSALKNRLEVSSRVKESQLALLMSQLNPHFLFNSLNSIRGMMFENKELAKDLVDKLNELFKYNLSSNKKATASLKEELRICEFYLDIEHIRLEERLLIEMHVESGCDSCKIPTMGLLTLLENAIKHAIAPRIEQSLLSINIHKDKKYLFIKVTNPVYQGNYHASGTGTGQSNLLKRLQLMYGDDAKLTTEQQDELYIAQLTVPLGK